MKQIKKYLRGQKFEQKPKGQAPLRSITASILKSTPVLQASTYVCFSQYEILATAEHYHFLLHWKGVSTQMLSLLHQNAVEMFTTVLLIAEMLDLHLLLS